MLRYTTDQDRYDAEVRMHSEMGLNLIRVWGGGITERPKFYEAADRYGLFVMQVGAGDKGRKRWGGGKEDRVSDVVCAVACALKHTYAYIW